MVSSGMSSQDCLRKAIDKDGEASIAVVDATQLVQESMLRIQSLPPATIHLGQAMMGAILLLSTTDKADTQKISLQWNVDGPFGHLYVESTQLGHARGTIGVPQPQGVKDFDSKLGNGLLQVRRISETTFTGLVPAKGDVGNDIVEYLDQSEQRRAGVNFTVKLGWREAPAGELPFVVEAAYGYLIDLLPQANPLNARAVLKKWDGVMRSLGNISDWAIESGGSVDPTSQMLRLISGESSPKETVYQRVVFHCPCSKDRAEQALALASKIDGQPKQKDEESVVCEFCGKVYVIVKEGN
jgi:molecular chaperone Hsp33